MRVCMFLCMCYQTVKNTPLCIKRKLAKEVCASLRVDV